jgi:spore germination cell wall hydrolase CwlJ-like protein
MKSKPILLTMAFSAFIIFLSMVNVDLYNLPFKASFESLDKETQKQVTCLADNMYFEAAHEPLAGKKAVAFVTINRLQTGNYADDICGVVTQKTGRTCQFSWYCESKHTNNRLTIRESSLYNEIRQLAVNMVVNFERYEDVTKGATFYHADYVNPQWNLKKVDQIGRHIFYKSNRDQIDRNKGIIQNE